MAAPTGRPGRLVALALLGAVAIGLRAPDSRAGCHVADPPRALRVLLSRLGHPLPSSVGLDPEATTDVVPRPCEDPHAAPAGGIALDPIGPGVDVDPRWATFGSSPLIPIATGIVGPATLPGRLERPPR